MKRKIINAVGLIALVVLVIASTTAYAESETAVEQEKIEQTKKQRVNFIQELNLTDEQQEQLKSRRSISQEGHAQLRDKMQEKRQELRQELEKQEIDQAKVQALITEIKNLTGEQLEQRAADVVSMREILTPQQCQQLQEKTKERRQIHERHTGQDSGKRSLMKGRFWHKF